MKSYAYLALVAVTAFSVAACGGKSDTEKAAEQMQKAAEEMSKSSGDAQKGAEEMAKGFEAMAKGLAGAAGADGDLKPVDPVSFKELQAVMSDVSGWTKENPEGERMTSPFAFSQASVTYKKGDADIDLKIMDSGFNQLLFAPFAMFMSAGYEKETQDGFERSVNVNGNPGWEKYSKGSRDGELNVVVNKRFLVQVEGRGIDDTKALRAVFDATDVKKLASLT